MSVANASKQIIIHFDLIFLLFCVSFKWFPIGYSVMIAIVNLIKYN